MNPLTRLQRRYAVALEPVKTERRVEMLLIGLAVLVLLQLLWIGVRAVLPGVMAPVPPSADSMLVQEPAHMGSITFEDSFAVQSRPLFWQSRRPLAPAPAEIAQQAKDAQAVASSAKPLKNLKVTGVYGGGGSGGAIITYDGEQRRLAVGDELDGWTLIRAAHGEAVWSSGAAQDVRRLLPQPVIAAVQALPDSPSAQASGSEAQSTPDLSPTVAEPLPNKADRSLSSGG